MQMASLNITLWGYTTESDRIKTKTLSWNMSGFKDLLYSFLTHVFYSDLDNPNDLAKCLRALNLAQIWQDKLNTYFSGSLKRGDIGRSDTKLRYHCILGRC